MLESMAWCGAASKNISLLMIEVSVTWLWIDEHQMYDAPNIQAADVKDLVGLLQSSRRKCATA